MMIRRKSFIIIFNLLIAATFIFASNPDEYQIQEIKLSGEVTSPKAEISGLAWYNDNLILLPQFPERFSSRIFSIPKSKILEYLSQSEPEDIKPFEIHFSAPDYRDMFAGFEGFEAICFSGNTAFITVETEPAEGIKPYLVKAALSEELNELKILPNKLTPIPCDLDLKNMAYETMIIFNNKLFTIYEANGIGVNKTPQAHQFDFDLNYIGPINFPSIEYRITDATEVDENGCFWAINYFYPGEEDVLKPVTDQITEKYGKGESHFKSDAVERLVEFQIDNSGIHLTQTPPIQLQLLTENDSRNWEGIVRLENKGFLIATDRFPETILAFVPYSELQTNLNVFEENDSYGFKNKKGEVKIPAQFILAQEFNRFGIAAVVDDSGWVYINTEGKNKVRPFVVDNGPDYFSEGLARFAKNGKVGFFDESGKVVIKAKFDFANPFDQGFAEICEGCKFVSDGEYKKIIGGVWKVIDKTGEVVKIR